MKLFSFERSELENNSTLIESQNIIQNNIYNIYNKKFL